MVAKQSVSASTLVDGLVAPSRVSRSAIVGGVVGGPKSPGLSQ